MRRKGKGEKGKERKKGRKEERKKVKDERWSVREDKPSTFLVLLSYQDS